MTKMGNLYRQSKGNYSPLGSYRLKAEAESKAKEGKSAPEVSYSDSKVTIVVLFDDFVTLIDRLHRVTQKRKVPLVTAHRSCHDVPDFLES